MCCVLIGLRLSSIFHYVSFTCIYACLCEYNLKSVRMEDKYEGCSFNSRTIAIAETVVAVEL